MNLIKLACTRGSSQVGLALVDAIVATIKDAGLGSRNTKSFRYSQISDRVEEMTDEAVEHVALADKVPTLDFFKTPAIADGKINHELVVTPIEDTDEAIIWSASWALSIKRLCNKHPDLLYGRCSMIMDYPCLLPDGSEGQTLRAFVVSTIYKHNSMWMEVAAT